MMRRNVATGRRLIRKLYSFHGQSLSRRSHSIAAHRAAMDRAKFIDSMNRAVSSAARKLNVLARVSSGFHHQLPIDVVKKPGGAEFCPTIKKKEI